MTKTWLSYQDQVDQLRARGLDVADEADALYFLSCVNYYRFSGYFRYWQRDPAHGDNQFVQGASFRVIRDVYVGEQAVAGQAMLALRRIELLLRTKFAHYYAQRVRATGGLVRGEGLTPPTDPSVPRVEDHVLRDLDRSKETYIAHYRDCHQVNTQKQYLPQAYDQLPVWVAVEALSFGTLSRCIQASADSGVLDDIADSICVSRKVLASQVRSFVYLRNRIAHHARIWNHSVLDAPAITKKLRLRAYRVHKFEHRSVYNVLVALDGMLASSKMEQRWLGSNIDPLLDQTTLLARGLRSPVKYGQMDLS